MELTSLNHCELSAATQAQRAQALEHFRIIRSFLKDGVPLTHIAALHQLSLRTLRRWVQQYRSYGLAGLIQATRKDQEQRRSVTPQLQQVIERFMRLLYLLHTDGAFALFVYFYP